MSAPAADDRIREYLARQAQARTRLWPAYRERMAGAATSPEARQVDADARGELAALLGVRALVEGPRPFVELLGGGMLAHFDDRCAYCGRPLPIATWKAGAVISAPPWALEYHTDHVAPKSRGGANNHTNFVPACAECNQTKHARSPEQWSGARAANLK